MADYQLSYTGNEINTRIGQVPTLVTQMAEIYPTATDVPTTAASGSAASIQGWYVQMGHIVVVNIRLVIGSTPTTTGSANTLTAANTFPIPYQHPSFGSQPAYGYLSSGQVNGAFYINQTGALVLNGSSAQLAANSTHQIAGAYLTA